MKRIILLIAFFVCTLSYSQIMELGSLSSGRIVFTDIIYDYNKDLYGYFYIFYLDNIDKEKGRYEYVFLDKNLNKVANGEFEKKYYKSFDFYFINASFLGDSFIVNLLYSANGYSLMNTFFTINLKDKTVSKETYFEDGEFKELDLGYKELKKVYKKSIKEFNLCFGIYNDDFQGFYVKKENNFFTSNYSLLDFKVYDLEKNHEWTYTFNETENKKDFKIFTISNVSKDLIIGQEERYENNKPYDSECNIVGINSNNGEKLFDYNLENLESEYNHTINTFVRGDKIYIVGNFSPYDKRNDYDWEEKLGVYRIVLDKNGKELSKDYFFWKEASNFMEIKETGLLKNGYRLKTQNFFVFEDGSMSYLAEKQKNSKRTDLVLFNFNSGFNLIDVKTIEKDKSKGYQNDYLFSQYIKDKTGVVFFFRDYQKDEETRDKNWILGINTIINGEYNYEEIPMSSDNNYISPAPAKEGYILLNERNEKEKFNQLRLERLNY